MKDLDEHKKIQIPNSIGIVPPIVIILIIKLLLLNIVFYSFICLLIYLFIFTPSQQIKCASKISSSFISLGELCIFLHRNDSD